MIDVNKLIGLNYEAAKEEVAKGGMIYRLVSVDGNAMVVTADYQTNRVNLSINEDNIVTLADIG